MNRKRGGIPLGVGVVHAVHARPLDDHIGLDLDGAQRRGGVGGEVRIPGAGAEDHDALLFEMPHGAPADERFGDDVHADGGHQPRDHALMSRARSAAPAR